MDWNNHWELEGRHSMLSPSQYSWLNYDADKMATVFQNKLNIEDGTRLHFIASEMIKYRIKPDDIKRAFNQFVLDCIADGMSSEVILKYSDNAFGTADGIRFDEKTKELRVYDLKTGTSKPSFKQLSIYCALFCLEYKQYKPKTFVCRIYQGRGYTEETPDIELIKDIMDKIVELDKVITFEKDERRKLGF